MEIHKDQLIALIKKSVEDILQKEFQITNGCFDSGSGDDRRKLLILIPDFVVQFRIQLGDVIKEHAGYKIFLCSYKPLAFNQENNCVFSMNMQDDTVREAIIDHLNEIEKICILNTGMKQISKIVNGDEDDFVSKVILCGLLHNKQISLRLTFNPYETKASVLSEKAVKLVHSAESMNISVSYPNSDNVQSEEQTGCSVITQHDIEAMYKTGKNEIFVSPKCIITPLAKDRMKELKIKVMSV